MQKTLQIGDQISCHNLTIAVLPFLSHLQYDQLLWACDLNFIRGEDSCVRAQWAGKPFIWHIYPQDENAHLIKLQAWMDQVKQQVKNEYLADYASWQTAMQAWNDNSPSNPKLCQQLLTDLSEWTNLMSDWNGFLAAQPDLARRLMNWVKLHQLE